MQTIDDPFKAADWALSRIEKDTKVILIDMHAEATAEKMALAWHLDGRVSAFVGTHTHIPTSDARILPKGTAYITDVGMTGPYRFGDRHEERNCDPQVSVPDTVQV